MGLYDTGGFDTLGHTLDTKASELGTKIDSLNQGIGQTRTTIETAGGQIRAATEMVHEQLMETASFDRPQRRHHQSSLENSSVWLINALKVSNETVSKNAQEIKDQITALPSNLANAGQDLQMLQACQTERQSDFLEKQVHQQSFQSPAQASPSPATRPPQQKQ